MANEAKRLLKDSLDESPELPLMPMIDVVFQLLIFFLFAMKFSGREGRLYAKLPMTGICCAPETPDVPWHQVRIKLLWVQKNNWLRRMTPEDYRRAQNDPSYRAYWTNNGMAVLKIRKDFLMRGGMNDPGAKPDWDALLARIERAKRRFRPTRSFPTLPVIIEGYELVPFQHIVTALNICIKAGIENITFAAPEIPIE